VWAHWQRVGEWDAQRRRLTRLNDQLLAPLTRWRQSPAAHMDGHLRVLRADARERLRHLRYVRRYRLEDRVGSWRLRELRPVCRAHRRGVILSDPHARAACAQCRCEVTLVRDGRHRIAQLQCDCGVADAATGQVTDLDARHLQVRHWTITVPAEV
jgi:hypothetical protein